MTESDKQDLTNAVKRWQEKLNYNKQFPSKTFNTNRCVVAINALNKEIEMGKPHCTCHLLEYKDCPTINS